MLISEQEKENDSDYRCKYMTHCEVGTYLSLFP